MFTIDFEKEWFGFELTANYRVGSYVTPAQISFSYMDGSIIDGREYPFLMDQSIFDGQQYLKLRD